MNFAIAADRIQHDFKELPGLELTIGQAIRLWNLGADDCRQVLDALVDAGFLRWTAKRTIVRADHARAGAAGLEDRKDGAELQPSYISVRQSRDSDISSRRA